MDIACRTVRIDEIIKSNTIFPQHGQFLLTFRRIDIDSVRLNIIEGILGHRDEISIRRQRIII